MSYSLLRKFSQSLFCSYPPTRQHRIPGRFGNAFLHHVHHNEEDEGDGPQIKGQDGPPHSLTGADIFFIHHMGDVVDAVSQVVNDVLISHILKLRLVAMGLLADIHSRQLDDVGIVDEAWFMGRLTGLGFNPWYKHHGRLVGRADEGNEEGNNQQEGQEPDSQLHRLCWKGNDELGYIGSIGNGPEAVEGEDDACLGVGIGREPGHPVVDLGQELNPFLHRNRCLVRFVDHVHERVLLSKACQFPLRPRHPAVCTAFFEEVDGLGELFLGLGDVTLLLEPVGIEAWSRAKFHSCRLFSVCFDGLLNTRPLLLKGDYHLYVTRSSPIHLAVSPRFAPCEF
jgi:hypothetical protein